MEITEVHCSSPIFNDAEETSQEDNESLVSLQIQNIKCQTGHAMIKSSLPNCVCDKCRTSNLDEHWRCEDCDEDICFVCAEKDPGCFEKTANSKIGRALMDSHAVRFVKRIIPLLLALWVKADMILDVRQSIAYYRHSFSDGAYAKWAKEYQNETNSTYLQSVSTIYFVTASIIWVASPLLISIFSLMMVKHPLPCTTMLLDEFLNHHIGIECFEGEWYSIALGIVLIPFDILGACIFIYVLIPYASLKRGIKFAWTGKDYDENDVIGGGIQHGMLPFLKSFEFLGEALPQLLLAIIFTANNYPYLARSQTYFKIYKVFNLHLYCRTT